MKKSYLYALIAIVLVLAGGYYLYTNAQKPGQYDSFATCLKNAGATFYGAYWCPHCQEQKKMFGKSADLLPYVECSLPSGRGQTQACIDAKVESYPTWQFPDGTRLTGTQQFATLAEKTSCTIQ